MTLIFPITAALLGAGWNMDMPHGYVPHLSSTRGTSEHAILSTALGGLQMWILLQNRQTNKMLVSVFFFL